MNKAAVNIYVTGLFEAKYFFSSWLSYWDMGYVSLTYKEPANSDARVVGP